MRLFFLQLQMNKLNEQIDYLGESLFYFAKREESNEVMEKDEIEKLEEVNQRSKSNTKRLDEHDTDIKELQNTYRTLEAMNYRMGNVEKNVQDINSKLEKVSEDKGKKWDKLIDYIFYFILASILGYIAVKLGIR